MAAPPLSADTADFAFKVEELDADALKVLAFEGTEGISKLFRFRVQHCVEEANIDLAACLGAPASLEIKNAGAVPRYVSGILWRFERTGHGSSLTVGIEARSISRRK